MSAPGPEKDEPVAAIYAQRFPDEDESHTRWRRELWGVLVEDFFSKWISSDATVLDFGCGHGEFINAVEARRRIGVDIRPDVVSRLVEGVEFQLAREVRLEGVSDDSVDVVFCSNLLEHMRDREAVTALLLEFRRVLSARGRLLVLGPNLRYTGAAYWDFFDHIIPLTHVSLVEALSTANLEAETLIPRFLPYTTVGSRRTPLSLVRLYLKLPVAWRLLGAQFFAVARAR